jgi:hypothetical protein
VKGLRGEKLYGFRGRASSREKVIRRIVLQKRDVSMEYLE